MGPGLVAVLVSCRHAEVSTCELQVPTASCKCLHCRPDSSGDAMGYIYRAHSSSLFMCSVHVYATVLRRSVRLYGSVAFPGVHGCGLSTKRQCQCHASQAQWQTTCLCAWQCAEPAVCMLYAAVVCMHGWHHQVCCRPVAVCGCSGPGQWLLMQCGSLALQQQLVGHVESKGCPWQTCWQIVLGLWYAICPIAWCACASCSRATKSPARLPLLGPIKYVVYDTDNTRDLHGSTMHGRASRHFVAWLGTSVTAGGPHGTLCLSCRSSNLLQGLSGRTLLCT